ncbi:transketolase [Microvirga thermotolerans]|uniref:Transketolase n=2 Tax=Microvirga thermotolerans TaxID=2651334 RepID=A0A5P9JTL7_9HYPH|nr:transketolase [Microvirga thermotolerans]QFU15461.1 transketolase [Microvirga thermotolerans]
MPQTVSADRVTHSDLANAVRVLAMDAVEKAKSGHPGLPMGAADMATVLFTKFLKYDAADPSWPDRDRFVLSAGHGSMLLYALLHLTGVKDMTLDELKRFRQLDSKTPGHPENFMTPGVETTTGPLGQGIATAVGMALAERMLNAEYGDDLVDHRTYVLASDGDLMEGISQEAIALAGHLRLNRLIVLFDDNGISIDGPLSLSDSVDQVKRFQACGWNAVRVDGHDPKALQRAIARAQKSDRPTLIACRTTIGFGAPKKAGTSKAHGEPLGAEELAGAKKALGWDHAPFEIPETIRAAWAKAGKRGRRLRKAWAERLKALPAEKRAEFERRMKGVRPQGIAEAVARLKERLVAEPQAVATRKASEIALEVLTEAVPELVLGSADLTPSNNTKTKNLTAIAPGQYAGRYIHYGIREHGMAAAMNGIALHGGLVPAGATFLVFTDYARPAMRIAALSGIPAVYVMTHDSIGLGEDGPTHQPVEHLAALRAMPKMRVFRPADAVETAECWQLALERTDGPTVLALTRQNLPQIRREAGNGNLCATGAYELSPAQGKARATIFASGSEVEIALAAQNILAEQSFAVRVVSVPSLDLFLAQPEKVRARIVGDAPVKVAVEAAVRFGWDSVIGPDGIFVGMQGFGASAPYKELYRHFGITAEAVAEHILRTHNL